MAQQNSQQQQHGAPRHVPLSEITHQGLLRALGAEAEALQKIHVRIQKQLQNLEMEEKLFKHMIQRERNAHTAQELEQFDAEMQMQHQRIQQQQELQARQQAQHDPQPEQHAGVLQPEIQSLQQQEHAQDRQDEEGLMQEE